MHAAEMGPKDVEATQVDDAEQVDLPGVPIVYEVIYPPFRSVRLLIRGVLSAVIIFVLGWLYIGELRKSDFVPLM